MRKLNTSTRSGLTGLLIFFVLFSNTSIAETTPPPKCAGYGDIHHALFTDWEDGIESWTVGTHDIADPTFFKTADWSIVGNLPGSRPGNAAFVADLDVGGCADEDQSGALTLDSPTVAIPADAEVPRISIQHWFDTEYEYDGGNIKISVNGGNFETIPAEAFEYGPYNDELLPPLDSGGFVVNSNPLAGQDAFTGTIDGAPSGTWVDIRINLLGLVSPGDTVKLRFDFGIDSCDGAIGWYVDDVDIYSCAAELTPSDCGNGKLDAEEQCDDGNDFVNDGCSNTCQIEKGWDCSAPAEAGIVSDPGFESGTPNPFWNEVSNNPIGTPICEVDVCGTAGGTGPAEGMFWAFFGGTTSRQEGSVSQSVEIPSTVSKLTFELEIPACDSASDYLEVLIDDQQQLQITGTHARCGDEGYFSQSVDISAFSDNENHELEFHAETFVENGGVSTFFVDNIALPGNPSECTRLESSLTLNKKVINDDGGSLSAQHWTLTADGPSNFSGSGPTVSSDSGFQPGTYDLSEQGPSGYEASDWVCEGGTQIDGNTITLDFGETASCTITNDDIPSSDGINAGHAGAWFNPATAGQGQLIDIDTASRFMFMSWFTYTEAASGSPFEQRWLTAQGNYGGNSATLDLFETLGGKFDAPQEVTTTKVGEVSLQFDNCIEGEMTYTIEDENLQGSFPLLRVIPGSENTCLAIGKSSTQAIDINAGMDGAWFEPATSGQGFLIDTYPNDTSGDFMFVAWFTYGDDTPSGQRWLTAQGGFEGSTATLTVYETTGGSFDDPKVPETVEVGTMTIDFVDCSNAELSYSISGEELQGSVSIQRVLPDAKELCEEISGTE